MGYQILFVEDDNGIAAGLVYAMENEGYVVVHCREIAAALIKTKEQHFDLALIDMQLPDGTGREVANVLRRLGTPVIYLTIVDDEDEIVRSLEGEAADYITKPFNPLEVAARVKTQLRRYQNYNNLNLSQPEVKDEYDIRGLLINRASHKCYLYGKEISLTPLEFSILWYLCEHQGKVVDSEELFEAVWKEKYFDSNNTVMAHIARLREKMGEPARKPRFIKTVWGVGYTIEK